MELTAFAGFLDTVFGWYDRGILSALHAISCGPLTFLFKFITLIGEKGIIFFFLALVLMCYPKTRKMGICLFGAVACGALITNIILKDWVARPRPFNYQPYAQWWMDIGSPAEDGFSFPSGHATAAAAGMVAIRLMKGKKWTVPTIVWVVLIAIARNYLMAHFPSDVLFGVLFGAASAVIAFYITQFIYSFLHANRRAKWAQLVLNWSAPDVKGIPSRLGLAGIAADEPDARSVRTVPDERMNRNKAADRQRPENRKDRQPYSRTESKHAAGYKGRHEK